MQSGENKASKSQSTKAEEDAARLESTEVSAAPVSADEVELQQEQEKQKLEEEQPQSKLKARSRFSAAFRSLSKPKSKKPKESKEVAKEEPKSQEQLEVISAGEDINLTSTGDLSTDSGVQKKRSLTRRLLLGSLKPKSKVRPHSLATSDEISLRSSSRERVAPSSSSSSTLQITISGKKVEPLAKGKSKSSSSNSGSGSKSKSHSSETDYLTPTPTDTTTATTSTATTAIAAIASGKSASTTTKTTSLTTSREDTTTGNSRTTTTKLIVAKVAKKPAAKKKQQQQKQLKAEEEKIVITESRRDTPPRERAPAKPSRASGNPSQYVSNSGAVRKSNSSSSTTSSTRVVSLPSRKERELMQQQQQRGHRLTRSLGNNNSTTAAPDSPVQALETPPLYPPPAPPPPPPAKTPAIVLASLSDVEEQTDVVSLAESAHAAGSQPVVRFAVGSAVRGPAADAEAYEAALAAAATQQPSSSEEPSDSSLRRLSFAHQEQFALSDHDSIEGRRETLHYRSVASEGSNEDSHSEDGGVAQPMPAFGDLTMDQEMEPTIMAPTSEKREHLYKILVIGELGTGKTSFIKRYVHQFFSQNYRATIGVDFALKVLHWDANTIVRLQLWDIAGQERFGNMTRVYYKEAVGAFIVFDVTRSGTFDCVSKWKEDLDSKVQLPDGSPIPCILLANKCDQEKQGIVTQPERMDEYVRENGFAGWFETSAKENINIDESARALVNKILINDKLITADANDADKLNLSSAADASADAKSKCAC